jgi:hypothetical protein
MEVSPRISSRISILSVLNAVLTETEIPPSEFGDKTNLKEKEIKEITAVEWEGNALLPLMQIG